MRFRSLLCLVSVVVGVLAAGCPRTHRSVCEDRVRLTCELAFRCCTPEEAAFVLLGPAAAYATSEGECFDRFAPSCRAEDVRDDAVVAGRLAVDGDAAAACVAALAAARDTCDLVAFRAAAAPERAGSEAGPCARVTEGVVADGEPCDDDEECGRGGFCAFEGDVGTSAGACVRPGEVGDACGISDEGPCAEGLICTRGVCAAPPEAGEACPSFACAEGNVCNAEQICEPLPRAGEPCTFGCSAALFCDDDDDDGEGVCTAVRAPGETCDGALGECGPEQCVSGRCTGNEEEGVCATPQ